MVVSWYDDKPPLASAQQEVYAHLREQIFLGKLRAGTRLNPGNIATALGVSRMPVREAVLQLASEGLVLIRPNRGAVVMSLQAADVEEIFQMRAALEVLALHLALPVINDTTLHQLDEIRLRMEQAHAEPAKWLEWHNHFHDTLCGISGRTRLTAEVRRYRALIHSYVLQHQIKVHRTPEMAGYEHKRLLDTIRTGDSAEAEAALRNHIINGGKAVIRTLGSGLITSSRS